MEASSPRRIEANGRPTATLAEVDILRELDARPARFGHSSHLGQIKITQRYKGNRSFALELNVKPLLSQRVHLANGL